MKEDEARAWEEARAILRDKDATIERLQARVAELEAEAKDTADDCRIFSRVYGVLADTERERFARRADRLDALLNKETAPCPK